MSKILLIFLLFIDFSLAGHDLKLVRQEFYHAVESREAAQSLYNRLKTAHRGSPILTAYYGSAQTLLAKHSWNPYKKMSLLKSGLADIGTAVQESPENLEIRFLRFSIEYYIPSFLGLSSHLEADQRKIVELVGKRNFGTADDTIVRNMVAFMKKTGRLSHKEVTILNEGINNG